MTKKPYRDPYADPSLRWPSEKHRPPSDPLRFAQLGVERSLRNVVLCRDLVRMKDDCIERLIGPAALVFFDDSPALVRTVAQIQAERGELGLAVTRELLEEGRQRLAAGGVSYLESWNEVEVVGYLED